LGVGVVCWVVGGRVRPRRHENRRLLRVWGVAKAAAAPKVYTVAVGEKHAQVPKVGRAGDEMVVAGP
jgi:hypothetical protein